MKKANPHVFIYRAQNAPTIKMMKEKVTQPNLAGHWAMQCNVVILLITWT